MFLFDLNESIEEPIEVVKNMNKHQPHKKYTGKFSMFLLNNAEKIIVNNAIINRGLNIVQKIPKTESLYLDAKFFFTISSNKNISFFLSKTIKPHIIFLI